MPYQPNIYDSHMHTPLCKHARGPLSAYAERAEQKGLRGITFTCHSPMPDGWDAGLRMTLAQLPQYVDMVERARRIRRPRRCPPGAGKRLFSRHGRLDRRYPQPGRL